MRWQINHKKEIEIDHEKKRRKEKAQLKKKISTRLWREIKSNNTNKTNKNSNSVHKKWIFVQEKEVHSG